MVVTDEQQTPDPTIRDQVKALLIEAYELAKENPGEFRDSNVHVHIGSIMNKFLGGINRDSVPAVQETTGGSKYKTFKPTAEDFKKKSKPLPAAAEEGPEADDPLLQMTLPELKVKAKSLGIMYSNKTPKQLIMEIYHHEKHLLVSRKSKFKQDLVVDGQIEIPKTKLVLEDDDDFTPSQQVVIDQKNTTASQPPENDVQSSKDIPPTENTQSITDDITQ